MNKRSGFLLIGLGVCTFIVGAIQVIGPAIERHEAYVASLPTPTPAPRCREVTLSDGKLAIACQGGGYGSISPVPPVFQPSDDGPSWTFDYGDAGTSGDYGSGSGWDMGGGWDSGSWDGGGWDSGSWDSGGSDAGSW
jgi:hypothetical protein